MRATVIALAALIAASPVAAADDWIREQEVGFSQCRHKAFDLRMRPAQRVGERSFDDFAIGSLLSPEGDEGLEFHIGKERDGPGLTSADIVWPGDGHMPDAAFIRVSVDGNVVRPDAEEEYEWYEWYPANDDAWYRALRAGKRLKVEYLDEDRELLGAREIDLAPLSQMIGAVVTAGWSC